MKKLTKVFLLLICIVLLGSSSTEKHIQKLQELPLVNADLSIRFQHIEPYFNAAALLAHYPMDEGSGYEFLDHSGKNNTAFITGTQWNTDDSGLTTSFRRKGKRAGSVYLNGTQWLQVKDHSAFQDNTGLTISMWLMIEKNFSLTEGVTLVSKEQNNKGFELKLIDPNTVCFIMYDAAGKEHKVCSKDNNTPLNQWTHITATTNPDKGLLQVYINGILSAQIQTTSFRSSIPDGDLTLGSKEGKAGIKGSLDEVSFFSKALLENEIKELYTFGLPKTYAQTRETIDSEKKTWTVFKGNQPIPHPLEKSTVFALNFDKSILSEQGHSPKDIKDDNEIFAPGEFGGAYNGVSNTKGLVYNSPIKADSGTLAIWFIPAKENKAEGKHTLFQANGKESAMDLFYENKKWNVKIQGNGKPVLLASKPIEFESRLIHLGITWGKGEVSFYVNGVEVDQESMSAMAPLNNIIQIGGEGAASAHGYVDDVQLYSIKKDWKSICPRGIVDTESAPLDLMDGFDHEENEPVFYWMSPVENASWQYSKKDWEDDGAKIGDSGSLRRSLKQNNSNGIQSVYHPDAYGHASSIECGVSFEKSSNGWAGVFVKSPLIANEKNFSGLTFMINPALNQIRLALLDKGKISITKILPYDFKFKPRATYTLTLSSVNEILRGYIDGHNVISMMISPAFDKGFAGLITENSQAHFDDVHFSAITPSFKESRQIQQRIFSQHDVLNIAAQYKNLTLNAFRWKKRYGLLPWHRNYKNPEPPGNIFGPATDVVKRPNAVEFWRTEDDANSDILTVDGKMYYFMRGNPDFNGPHGSASIGTLTAQADTYDGLHFKDQNEGMKSWDNANLLRGHKDKSYCPDEAPRNERFQVNDEGAVLINDKILVLAREFKNPFAAFRRLIFGVYDIKTQKWDQQVPHTVEWSRMNPDSCYAKISGLNATPEVTALRDHKTDEHIIFLYHGHSTKEGVYTTGITGLHYDGTNLSLHPEYPVKTSYTKQNEDNIYGERIFFDNGIYYMHVNAGSDKSKLRRDWPDRMQLFMSLHPYNGPWSESMENHNTVRPYFTRGGEFDPDNAAIWQGTMFKNRNKYYMYYENFHSIGDVNNPYDQYDEMHSGSRVGYCTAN